MLDDYIKTQSIAHKIISNQIQKQNVSHAYIIESSSNQLGINFAKSFAKTLLCPNNYLNFKKCGNCKQCMAIDQNNFIEIKIIEPQGMWISTEQIEELQNIFMKKPLVGNKKIYIINHFEKMRKNLMDKMLKFIEEPLDGIIAILVTDNINKILDTIVSRCQIISLKKQSSSLGNNDLENIQNTIDCAQYKNVELTKEIIDSVVKFVKYYEENKINTILFTKELWHDIFTNQEASSLGLNIMLLFYKEILNYKINGQTSLFKQYEDIVKNISDQNDVDQLTHKIIVIMKMVNKIKYNVNLFLMMDKLIIELERK